MTYRALDFATRERRFQALLASRQSMRGQLRAMRGVLVRRCVGVWLKRVLLLCAVLAGPKLLWSALVPEVGIVDERLTFFGARRVSLVATTYIAENPGGGCPTMAELLDDYLCESRVDAWGQDFVIECVGDDIIVTSFGPDGLCGTEDDISTGIAPPQCGG